MIAPQAMKGRNASWFSLMRTPPSANSSASSGTPPKTAPASFLISAASMSVAPFTALNAFSLKFLNPATTAETIVFIGFSFLVFLLLVAFLVLLVRNVLKLYADQRKSLMGTRLRWRMLWGAVLVSVIPLVCMYGFSYDLMNRAVDRWFSQNPNEIAQLLDCSIGNSKSQLHKAKLKMRALLFPKTKIRRRPAKTQSSKEGTGLLSLVKVPAR